MTDPAASRQFWTGYLAGAVAPRPLPGYLREGVTGTALPAKAEMVLSPAESEQIHAAASAAGLGSSTMVSAALALLRARHGDVTDVLIAVTRSCLPDSVPDAEAIIGPLINTVPLRVRIGDGWSAREFLTSVNDGIRQIRAHQRTPIGSALGWAGLLDRDASTLGIASGQVDGAGVSQLAAEPANQGQAESLVRSRDECDCHVLYWPAVSGTIKDRAPYARSTASSRRYWRQ